MRRSALQRPNWMEVDLDALAHNAAAIRAVVGPRVGVFAALKADAYGYGLEAVAKTVLDCGVNALAVGDVEAGVRLRQYGVKSPVLVYAGCLLTSATVEAAQTNGLALTLLDLTSARSASALAPDRLKVFIKLDSGLERLGLDPAGAADEIIAIGRLPRLAIEGLYTHMHIPPVCPPEYAVWQFERFGRVVTQVRQHGLEIPIAMAASSAVLAVSRAMNLNAVDPGRLFYGLVPPGEALTDVEFRPVLKAIKTRLVQVKTLSRTEFVELAPYQVQTGMRIGILPFGRADGLSRVTSGEVLVRGCRARLLGEVAIEHTRVDLTSVPDAQPGDEVVVVGRQGSHEIVVADVAKRQRFVGHVDLTLSVGSTLEKVYLRNGATDSGVEMPGTNGRVGAWS